ncbi:hypothetical protein NE237_028356 [Protea cynaroides]|uniref:RNase H type-1 domain-containing protein n=1 Tax=Protea cynaroides TaxID=273540 RepID=A0A9Q0GQ73_9MAGN|nr:hypothetical protein NE237_028356 [Protea cynaroides]
MAFISSTWSPPPTGSYKLNCDASFDSDQWDGGLGYIIRSFEGHPCVVVSHHMNFPSVHIGETLSTLAGIMKALATGQVPLLVESDSLDVINLISDSSASGDPHLLFVIDDIRHLSVRGECSLSTSSKRGQRGEVIWPIATPRLTGFSILQASDYPPNTVQ